MGMRHFISPLPRPQTWRIRETRQHPLQNFTTAGGKLDYWKHDNI